MNSGFWVGGGVDLFNRSGRDRKRDIGQMVEKKK